MWHFAPFFVALERCSESKKIIRNIKKYVPLWHFRPHLHICCGTWAKIIEDSCYMCWAGHYNLCEIMRDKRPNLSNRQYRVLSISRSIQRKEKTKILVVLHNFCLFVCLFVCFLTCFCFCFVLFNCLFLNNVNATMGVAPLPHNEGRCLVYFSTTCISLHKSFDIKTCKLITKSLENETVWNLKILKGKKHSILKIRCSIYCNLKAKLLFFFFFFWAFWQKNG